MPITIKMIETLEPRVMFCGHSRAPATPSASADRAYTENDLVLHARDQSASGQAILSPIVAHSSLAGTVVAGTALNGVETVNLTNSGTAAERGAVVVNIFASPDGTVDDSALLVATLKRQVKINVNQTLLLRLKIPSLPSSLEAGTYALLAQALDSLDVTDAASGPTIQVVAPFVSLSASLDAVTPIVIKAGKSGSINVTITDNGNIPADGNALIEIGLSTDGQSEAVALKTVHQKLKIKPGGVATLRLRFAVPKSEPTGDYFAFFSVSENGQQAAAISSSRITIE